VLVRAGVAVTTYATCCSEATTRDVDVAGGARQVFSPNECEALTALATEGRDRTVLRFDAALLAR
jgi:hypothetical protein